MTPLSNARIESQKSGGHKDRTFAEEEEVRAPVRQARQDSRAGGEGLRVGSAGSAEVLLVPTVRLEAHLQQARQSTNENISSEG